MSLSDCPKCWDTPCTCGWEYRNYSVKYLEEIISMFQKIVDFKKIHPRKKFSKGCTSSETKADKELMEYIDKND